MTTFTDEPKLTLGSNAEALARSAAAGVALTVQTGEPTETYPWPVTGSVVEVLHLPLCTEEEIATLNAAAVAATGTGVGAPGYPAMTTPTVHLSETGLTWGGPDGEQTTGSITATFEGMIEPISVLFLQGNVPSGAQMPVLEDGIAEAGPADHTVWFVDQNENGGARNTMRCLAWDATNPVVIFQGNVTYPATPTAISAFFTISDPT